MGKTADDIYEAWDLSPVVMPERSTLYTLEPIGVGTAFVESLTSYIARLADAHSVFCGRLVENLIVPIVPGYSPTARQHELFRGDGSKSNLVNASGVRALYTIQALETLTLRTDLRRLTLLSLVEGFPSRGLIRHTRAWCPVCYEEWRTIGQIVYDPLFWVFQEIFSCMRHKQRLQTLCPYQGCRRSFQALAWRAKPGYCPFCQHWLGMSLERAEKASEPLTDDELSWQQWVSYAVGTTLTVAPILPKKPVREQISKVLTCVVQKTSGGKIAALARTLGLTSQQLGEWVRGESIPQMNMLFRLCYALGLPLHEVLFSDPTTLCPQVRGQVVIPPQSWRRQPDTPRNKEYLRQELDKFVASEEYPPLSFAEVTRRLGCGHGLLYQCHASACHAIGRRYMDYLRQRKQMRMQHHREEIKQVALQLLEEGVTLTQKHIRLRLVHPAIMRNPDVRKLVDEVCQELRNN